MLDQLERKVDEDGDAKFEAFSRSLTSSPRKSIKTRKIDIEYKLDVYGMTHSGQAVNLDQFSIEIC